MSELDLCLTKPEVYEYLNIVEGKALKDYLYDQISLNDAALTIHRSTNSALRPNQYFEKVMDILTLIAIDLSDSRKLRKIVKILVALRNLRFLPNGAFYLGRWVAWRKVPHEIIVLRELQTTIGRYLNCGFFFLRSILRYLCHNCAKSFETTLDLYDKVLAPLIGDTSILPESNIQFINLHTFIARLSSVHTFEIVAGEIFDAMINDDEIRNHRVIFNVIVSSAAQHMIYSASRVLKVQMKRPDYHGGFSGWQNWKVGFEEAQTNAFIGDSASKDAKLAVAGMNEAELVWNDVDMPRT